MARLALRDSHGVIFRMTFLEKCSYTAEYAYFPLQAREFIIAIQKRRAGQAALVPVAWGRHGS